MTGRARAGGPAAAGGALGAVFDAAAKHLQQAGIEQARLDARVLISHVLAIPPQEILLRPNRELTQTERTVIDASIARRIAHEPVSRIVGAREFWSLNFVVGPATLDPRPDSETLVESVLAELPDRAAPLRLLDLGTGTGCLLLALLSELPNARGIGTDISAAAIETARRNADLLNMAGRSEFIVTRWADGISGSFDIVVSNPPYIPSADIDRLAPEVARFDPRAALDGGADGLDAYRALAERMPALLVTDGVAAIEVGDGQAADVARIFDRAGLVVAKQTADLGARIRCLTVRRR